MTKIQRYGIGVIAVTSVAVAVGVGAAATSDTPLGLTPGPYATASGGFNTAGVRMRSMRRRALGAPGPGWLAALNARSVALNRRYGLGEYARQGAQHVATPDWLLALNARSEALNRRYGLGKYATKR